MLTIDHTKRSDFVTCPRKYQLRYIKNIHKRTGSHALRYGVAWHGAMEGFYTGIQKHGWGSKESVVMAIEMAKAAWEKESNKYDFETEDYRTLPNLMTAFMKYVEHFHFDEGILKVIAPESVFRVKITPTVDEQNLIAIDLGIPPFYYAGRMDCEVELNGRPWILEQKTTGQYLASQVQRLHRSPQVIGYNYAAKATSLLNEIPDGSLVTIHHISAYKSKTSGRYGDPKIDFARSPQIFSLEDLANWRLGLIADAHRLNQCYVHNFFPMNHYSCYNYGACTYINLCEQNRPIDDLILQNFFIDDDPWDVVKEGTQEGKLVTVEEKEGVWASVLQKI